MPLPEVVLEYAPWSVSKAGMLQICPKQFQFQHVLRLAQAPKSQESKVGTTIHTVLEYGLMKPPQDLSGYTEELAQREGLTEAEAAQVRAMVPAAEEYVRRITAFRLTARVVRSVVEPKLAISPTFQPVDFFARTNNLIRGLLDEVEITEGGVAILVDHKSGRRKPIAEHATQLHVYRLLIVANYPEVKGVQCAINYVGSPKLDWAPRPDGGPGPWTRGEIQGQLQHWLEHFLHSLARPLANMRDGEPKKNPGWACDWCAYVAHCPEGQAVVAERKAKRDARNV